MLIETLFCASPVAGSRVAEHAAEPLFDFRRILDCYQDPLFVIDAQRRVLFRNAAADRVLRVKGGFAERSGRLVLGAARADEALQSLLNAGFSMHAAQPAARRIRVQHPGSARDWLVVVRPLVPIFLVQVIGRTRPRLVPAHILRDLYELSVRETVVISALLRTGSIDNAARRLCLSRETVRSHLKRIFRKCDVRSQEDLRSLINCVAQFAANV